MCERQERPTTGKRRDTLDSISEIIADGRYALVVQLDADRDTRFCAVPVECEALDDVLLAPGTLTRFASVNENPLTALVADISSTEEGEK